MPPAAPFPPKSSRLEQPEDTLFALGREAQCDDSKLLPGLQCQQVGGLLVRIRNGQVVGALIQGVDEAGQECFSGRQHAGVGRQGLRVRAQGILCAVEFRDGSRNGRIIGEIGGTDG